MDAVGFIKPNKEKIIITASLIILASWILFNDVTINASKYAEPLTNLKIDIIDWSIKSVLLLPLYRYDLFSFFGYGDVPSALSAYLNQNLYYNPSGAWISFQSAIFPATVSIIWLYLISCIIVSAVHLIISFSKSKHDNTNRNLLIEYGLILGIILIVILILSMMVHNCPGEYEIWDGSKCKNIFTPPFYGKGLVAMIVGIYPNQGYVAIRNTGTLNISTSNLSVYADGEIVECKWSSEQINVFDYANCENPTAFANCTYIKLTSPESQDMQSC